MVKKPVSHQFQPSRIDAKTADVIESKAPVKREESAPARASPAIRLSCIIGSCRALIAPISRRSSAC